MRSARFRFYAELNDFLPPLRRHVPFEQCFELPIKVKHLIEAAGVPHTQVDLILINGESSDFDHRLHGGESVSVYPVFESIDISDVLRVRPEPLRELRFVLDTHLGRLAAYLRMLGFDTVYGKDWEDPRLARASSEEGRVLLTRDIGLLKRTEITRGYFMRETQPRRQIAEVLGRFDLLASIRPLTRCLACNTMLRAVAKDEIQDRIEPNTARYYDEFQLCPECGRVYWKGSHYRRMLEFIDELRSGG